MHLLFFFNLFLLLLAIECMIKTIVALGSVSMSGHDAKALFSYVTGKQAITEGEGASDKKDEPLKRRVAVYRGLVDIISNKEDKHEVCRNFFTFPSSGDSDSNGNTVVSAASIDIEPGTTFDTKWPSSYGVFVWASFDDLPAFHRSSSSSSTRYEPRLVSLVSSNGDGEGIEVYLSGTDNGLVVKIGAVRVVTGKYNFEIGQWYNIAVTHSQGKDLIFKTPELCVYVNGELVAKASVKLPSTSGALAHRTIGSLPKGSAASSLLQRTPPPSQLPSSSSSLQGSAMKRMSSFFRIGSSSTSSSSASSSSAAAEASVSAKARDLRAVDGSFKGRIASVTMTHSGTISPELVQAIFSHGPNFTLTSGYLK